MKGRARVSAGKMREGGQKGERQETEEEEEEAEGRGREGKDPRQRRGEEKRDLDLLKRDNGARYPTARRPKTDAIDHVESPHLCLRLPLSLARLIARPPTSSGEFFSWIH
jgi:hypothetical protein